MPESLARSAQASSCPVEKRDAVDTLASQVPFLSSEDLRAIAVTISALFLWAVASTLLWMPFRRFLNRPIVSVKIVSDLSIIPPEIRVVVTNRGRTEVTIRSIDVSLAIDDEALGGLPRPSGVEGKTRLGWYWRLRYWWGTWCSHEQLMRKLAEDKLSSGRVTVALLAKWETVNLQPNQTIARPVGRKDEVRRSPMEIKMDTAQMYPSCKLAGEERERWGPGIAVSEINAGEISLPMGFFPEWEKDLEGRRRTRLRRGCQAVKSLFWTRLKRLRT